MVICQGAAGGAFMGRRTLAPLAKYKYTITQTQLQIRKYWVICWVGLFTMLHFTTDLLFHLHASSVELRYATTLTSVRWGR